MSMIIQFKSVMGVLVEENPIDFDLMGKLLWLPNKDKSLHTAKCWAYFEHSTKANGGIGWYGGRSSGFAYFPSSNELGERPDVTR